MLPLAEGETFDSVAESSRAAAFPALFPSEPEQGNDETN